MTVGTKSSFYPGGSNVVTLQGADDVLAAMTVIENAAAADRDAAATSETNANTSATSATASAAAAAASLAGFNGRQGTSNPLMDGTATAGVSTSWTPIDHVHPTDTSRAPVASPALTGTPTAPTAAVDTNTTQLATTAFMLAQASSTNPVMDGGTGAIGTSTRFARADHEHPIDTSRAAVASPTFTGTPAAPTAAVDTNTTQLATTAFVLGQASAVGDGTPAMNGTAARGTSTHFARADHVHPTDTSRAPLASPALTGTPTAPTPTIGDNSTTVATTAFVSSAVATATGATPEYGLKNHTIAVSAASGALTIALKDNTGADPSVGSPVIGYFRSSTATSGVWSTLSVTSALSLVVPSAATLGVSSSVAFRLWVVLFNDAGTPRLGVINCTSSASTAQIYQLREGTLTSSTAISSSALSPGVFYTGTAATSKPYLIVGYIEWGASGITSGTWTTTNLAYVQSYGFGVRKPGDVVQQVSFTTSSTTSTSSASFIDSVISTSITPSSAANAVDVIANGNAQSNTAGAGCKTQLMRGSTAIGVGQNTQNNGSAPILAGAAMDALDFPNTTSPTTYKVQVASNAGGGIVIYPSGNAGGGGVNGRISLKEIMT